MYECLKVESWKVRYVRHINDKSSNRYWPGYLINLMKLLKEKDPLSIGALIGANLLPFFGIFLFDWDVRYIVVLYWIENLVVAFYNILKMAVLKTDQAEDKAGKLFIIPFFCIHYGGFCAVHGFFLIHFFKIGTGTSPLDNMSDWWGPLIFIQLLLSVIAKI